MSFVLSDAYNQEMFYTKRLKSYIATETTVHLIACLLA